MLIDNVKDAENRRRNSLRIQTLANFFATSLQGVKRRVTATQRALAAPSDFHHIQALEAILARYPVFH
ncbi:hypothetical protein [Paraburkholderia sp. SIMBA_030]|uniref:hypothetical protein n=1 Tax=Paraburkholderia sp. SIMBA_030 TaxID=3085773 RepID=UPI00397853B3